MDFDFVITVCANGKQRCPAFPSKAKEFYYNFPDLAKVSVTQEQIMKQFREVQNIIKEHSREFVAVNLLAV